jgi:long-chain acyl-CoA synthetase
MSVVAEERRASAPQEIALRDDNVELTWADLDVTLNRVVNALLNYGLAKDQRVAVFAENSANTVIAYLGIILAGLSGVPINYHLRTDECAYILDDAGAGVMFVGTENVEHGIHSLGAFRRIRI